METKPLLYGLIGFFIGGLIVSIAATGLNEQDNSAKKDSLSTSSMSMDDMTADLKNKTGDEYDKAFITYMIAHHEGAVEMAKLSANNAKHAEIKELSTAIVTAQEKEIADMKSWQNSWEYSSAANGSHPAH